MSPIEISCVVPAFETQALLRTCLLSLAEQRDVAAEIVVSDDSPSGAVRELIAAEPNLAKRVRYLAGARSGNPVDNWNFALTAARAPLRVLVHHDEYLIDPLYLRRAVDAMADPVIAAVIGGVQVSGGSPPSRFARARYIARLIGRPAWLLPSLNWIGPTAAFVFRKGPLFDPALVQLADVEFYRRVLRTGRRIFLSGRCVGSLGHHAARISARIDPQALAAGELSLLATGWELKAHAALLGVRAALA